MRNPFKRRPKPTEVSQPSQADIDRACQALVRDVESFLETWSRAVVRPVPVCPGIPDQARTMIAAWACSNLLLAEVLADEFHINVQTARLWIHSVREGY